MPRCLLANVAILALIPTGFLVAAPRYFHDATISSVEHVEQGQIFVIDSPLGIFTARAVRSIRRKPDSRPGFVRVSMDRKAQAGDSLYLIGEDGKDYRATILERKAHPPPPPPFT